MSLVHGLLIGLLWCVSIGGFKHQQVYKHVSYCHEVRRIRHGFVEHLNPGRSAEVKLRFGCKNGFHLEGGSSVIPCTKAGVIEEGYRIPQCKNNRSQNKIRHKSRLLLKSKSKQPKMDFSIQADEPSSDYYDEEYDDDYDDEDYDDYDGLCLKPRFNFFFFFFFLYF